MKPTTAVKSLFILAIAVSASCKHRTSEAGLQESASVETMSLVDHDMTHYDCSKPHYGIAWYGDGDTASYVVKGQKNPFFDPTKPTMLFLHGWQKDSTKVTPAHQESFTLTDPETTTKLDPIAAWKAAGWNVGLFQWVSFADEWDVRDAEAKIWTGTGTHGMRWRQCDGTYATDPTMTSSVGDLAYKAYVEAMDGYKGNNIRIVGHSLGNQLATRLVDLVAAGVDSRKIDSALMPKRLALVDPYWSAGGTDITYPGAKVREIVTKLKARGTLIEWYKCSGLLDLASVIGQADLNKPMLEVLGLTKPHIYYVSDEVSRHVLAPKLYFLSFGQPSPSCGPTCSEKVPSAAMSDEDLGKAMAHPTLWLQTSGMNTFIQSDDVYTKQ